MGDKRTLLAFLIIGLILLLMPRYYEWMGLQPPAPQADPESITETAPADELDERPRPPAPAAAAELVEDVAALSDPSSGAAQPAGEGGLPAPAPAAPAGQERRVLVTTPRHRVELSSIGGRIVSLEMSGYTVNETVPVELLNRGGQALAVVLESDAGERAVDLSQVEFVPDVNQLVVPEGGQGQVRLRADLGGGRYVEKRLTFYSDRYGIDFELAYDGMGENVIAYTGWQGGIAVAERDIDTDVQAMKAIAYLNEAVEEVAGDDDELERFQERGQLWWAGVRNRYFLAAFIPRDEGRQRVELSGRARSGDQARDLDVRIGTRLSAGPGSRNWTLYAGPLDYEELIRYEVELERAMSLGFPIIREISKLLLVLFVAAHQYIPNYGVVIIVFAVMVKALVYPLTHKSYESAARMQELQPKIAALKEKHKNDNQRLSQETMKLYKEEGVNPLGGCLPLLLQMPIFIALYQTFSNTIELRHAPFALWIDDLSRPDRLMFGDFELHVLPLLMSIAMFFQSKMTMKDPKQAAMVYVMPVVMVFIMWRFSSGLVLYWTCFNVLQIGQQVLTNHLKARKAALAQ